MVGMDRNLMVGGGNDMIFGDKAPHLYNHYELPLAAERRACMLIK
jgi:hypothetical protein